MLRNVVNLTLIAFILSTSAFADGKTLVDCLEGSPSVFNPQIAADGPSIMVTRNLYSNLVTFVYGETKTGPSLAESWEVSKDGLIYTFKLRKNVAFHTTPYFTPTRTFNADDVLFSFNRQRQKEHPYYAVGKTYEWFNSMDMGVLIKDIVKIDDFTVKFVLSRPEAPFIADMAMDFAGILSAEYGDQMLKKGTPQQVDIEPIGSGPFAFVRYDKDQTVRLKSHPKYWNKKPAIDNLIFSITPDASVRFQKLRTGECQFISEVGPADIDAMKADPNLTVMERPGLNVGLLAFNAQKKPFDNVLVRQAVAHALDRKAYLQAIFLNRAVLAKNAMPPLVWSHNNNVKDLDYNPEKSRTLLKKAGFPNGFTTELYTLPVSRPYNPNGKKMGEMMQSDLARVGITVKLVTFDWPTYLSKTRLGDHQIMQYGWTSDNGDPDNYLDYLFGCTSVEAGGNRTRWCDRKYSALTEKAKTISNQAERTKLYAQAQVIFAEQLPAVPIAHGIVYRAMTKKLTGFKIDPFGRDFFGYVDLK